MGNPLADLREMSVYAHGEFSKCVVEQIKNKDTDVDCSTVPAGVCQSEANVIMTLVL